MIKVLPEQIANLIAAGEVIQRPASVVKELIENAVDAKATSITVIINDYGKTLIQIIDNGFGMSKNEAVLCFERHATSKIECAEDLYKIETYGFRGEALASIAACADVTLKTKKDEEETATEVRIAEGKVISITETASATGTNIAVRNIFYNIPARRKFLKSDNAELRQIVSEFTKVALTRNDIDFKLIHNSKEISVLPSTENIKQRIVQIEGKNAVKDLIDIHADTSVVMIDGYVGNPELAKKAQNNQYFFVNNRYFRSPLFHKAIMKAYENLVQTGTSPSYYVFMTINPADTDVNIHPTKTEIKFENDSVIFQILNACVKEAIGLGAFVPGIDFDLEGAPDMPAVNADFYNKAKYLKPPKISYDPLFNPFNKENDVEIFNSISHEFDNNRQTGQETHGANLYGKGSGYVERQNIETHNEDNYEQYNIQSIAPYGKMEEDPLQNRALLILRGRYIITAVKSGIMIIDAIKAKERILYESYIDIIKTDNPAIQENMFPETVDLSPISFSLLMEYQEQLKNIGFDIRPFGDSCVVVYGIPAILSNEQISATDCIDNLLKELKELEQTQENLCETGKRLNESAKKKIALDLVKSESIYKSFAISDFEAQILIDKLFECKEPNIAIDGGLCATIMQLEDLLQKFKTGR